MLKAVKLMSALEAQRGSGFGCVYDGFPVYLCKTASPGRKEVNWVVGDDVSCVGVESVNVELHLGEI